MSDVDEDWRDPVVEVYKRDIDRTLLRANLKLTVTERLENAMAHARVADELRRAAREFRGSKTIFERVTADPAVMGGKACIRDLRFPVSRVLGLLAAGGSRRVYLPRIPILKRRISARPSAMRPGSQRPHAGRRSVPR
jgi:uncharacterized protein (DUF433 family)